VLLRFSAALLIAWTVVIVLIVLCAGSPKTTVIVLQDATGSQHSNFYGKRGFSKCKKKAGGQPPVRGQPQAEPG
jgi:hypothetical protein